MNLKLTSIAAGIGITPASVMACLATCSPKAMEIKGTVSVAGTNESWAHPVVFGGRLYLRYDDNLYCFDVKAK